MRSIIYLLMRNSNKFQRYSLSAFYSLPPPPPHSRSLLNLDPSVLSVRRRWWCEWIMEVDCVWVVGALENCERTRKYTFPNFSIILKSKLNPHSFIWWHRGTDNPVVHSLLLVFNHHPFSSHPRVCRWNK